MYDKKKLIAVLIWLLLFGLWWGTRFFRLAQSYVFFEDPGRDAWVLWQWAHQGKIPVLGPGVSALPMNVSPIYFYLLFPFFVLTKESYFYSQIALFVYCWAFIIGTGLILLRQKKQFPAYYLLILLLIFSPTFISQSRSVWNPSFMLAPLMMTFYSLKKAYILRAEKRKSLYFLLLSAICLALVTALNMSALPGFFAFLVLVLICLPRKTWVWLLSYFISLLVFYLPTLLFEIKYHFQISKRMLATFLAHEYTTTSENLITRLHKLLSFSLSSSWLGWGIFIFLLLVGGWQFWQARRSNQVKKLRQSDLFLALVGIIVTIFFSLIIPFPIAPHYVFCLLFFLFLAVINLPSWWNLMLAFLLLATWIFSLYLKPLTVPAVRTVADFDQCVQKISTRLSEPVFVAVQSSLIKNHDGKEYWYGLARHGVAVKEIDFKPEETDLLVVINEKATFTYGQDAFHELTLFGPAEIMETGQCRSDWGWTILRKIH